MMEAYFAALALSLGVFAALWPVSLALRDVSIVDAWWGPGFLGATALVWGLAGGDGEHALVVLGLVGVWSLRMGFTLLRRWIRHGAEDGRYVSVRAGWGASFWWKSFFIVFLLQGLLQWIVAFPAMAAVTATTPIGALGWAGVAVAVAGFLLEAKADAELDAFKRRATPDALLDTGLRKFVRHPNYIGELLFWWGVWLIAASADAWWTIFAPLTLTVLLTKVSGAGITGDHLKKTKPAYAAYAARTPAFLPRLFRR